jgi:hypothetical protein
MNAGTFIAKSPTSCFQALSSLPNVEPTQKIVRKEILAFIKKIGRQNLKCIDVDQAMLFLISMMSS